MLALCTVNDVSYLRRLIDPAASQSGMDFDVVQFCIIPRASLGKL